MFVVSEELPGRPLAIRAARPTLSYPPCQPPPRLFRFPNNPWPPYPRLSAPGPGLRAASRPAQRQNHLVHCLRTERFLLSAFLHLRSTASRSPLWINPVQPDSALITGRRDGSNTVSRVKRGCLGKDRLETGEEFSPKSGPRRDQVPGDAGDQRTLVGFPQSRRFGPNPPAGHRSGTPI